MIKLKFNVKINAPVEKVWNTMLNDNTYRQWTNPFYPGSYFKGSWEKGSKIQFLAADEKGALSGMTSEIAENRPYEFISIHHLGIVKDGLEDFSGEWENAYETYTFTHENGVTEINVELDSLEGEFAEMFKDMWPKALAILKKLSEKA